MARPIVVSNGSLHIGINKHGYVHDFYYPHVGQENHSAGDGTRHRIGIWIDGTISWLEDDEWNVSFETRHDALVGYTRAENELAGILIEFTTFVPNDVDTFIRTAHIVNLWDTTRDVRLFLHQAFVIGDSRSNHDTAQYLPDSDAILHYHGDRAFVVSGVLADEPFDQHSIGLFEIEGRGGTFRDADDGELAGGVVEHGRVDSTLRFKMRLQPHDSAHVRYWIACGTSTRDALAAHKQVLTIGTQALLHSTAAWWHEWLTPAREWSERISSTERRKQFLKSAMLLKSHIDSNGAIIASTDTTMLNYSRDAYGYCWPRDGAHVLWPLLRLGYTDEAQRFFDFCRDGLHSAGYLMHKYQADGSIGPSWHPYIHNGIQAPPIQEDETALVLYMFGVFVETIKDKALLQDFYPTLIKPMANFLARYIDESTGLPKPSYNLWEEHFATSTYTVGTVYAGLISASEMAERMHDGDSAVEWKTAADDIKLAANKYLYNEERGFFYKSLLSRETGVEYDQTIDIASFYGAVTFELFTKSSSEVKTSYKTMREIFGVTDTHPVLPRYENDNYQRNDNSALGNPWYITSLWLAQYAVESDDKDFAGVVLSWLEARLDATGMMSEQLDQKTSDAISVSPLAWSHAEYMTTVLDYEGANDV